MCVGNNTEHEDNLYQNLFLFLLELIGHYVDKVGVDSFNYEEFYDAVNSAAADLIVVAAYGKILPKEVLDAPRLGCVNIHGSLLPKYRGAAPIQRAVLERAGVTGVTLMYMAEGMDTGDIFIQKELEIFSLSSLSSARSSSCSSCR